MHENTPRGERTKSVKHWSCTGATYCRVGEKLGATYCRVGEKLGATYCRVGEKVRG